MKYHDSLSEAEKKSKLAIDLLNTHQLACNPLHFAIAYQHVSGTNPNLSQALDDMLASDSLGPYEMEGLFEQYISEDVPKSDENVENLTNCVEKLQTANDSSQTAMDSLETALEHEEANEYPALKDVVLAARAVRMAHDQVNKQLAETINQSDLLKKELQQARELAVTDTLTGLQNRTGLEQFMAHLAPQDFSKMAVAIADIDHFKAFNDEFGHLIGDLILKRLGKLLKEELPVPCRGFRFGGEEFVIVMPQCTPNQARDVAEEVRVNVSKLRFVSSKTRERLPKMTISLGVTSWLDGDNLEQALMRADSALYEAKNNGRNQVRLS